MHRQLLEILFQNPEYVKTHCNDRNNLFHSGNRKWMIEQKTDRVEVSVTFFENITLE